MKKDPNLLDFAIAVCYINTVIGCWDHLTPIEKAGYMAKEDWNYQFAEVENWLNSKGYEVVLETDVDDKIVWDTKQVFINSRNHPETRYYTLLHECGHLLISQGAKQWSKDVPMYASVEDLRVEKSKAYRVSLVAEEIEAWKRGRRLGKRFKHFINDEKYDKQITECVFGYIELAALEH